MMKGILCSLLAAAGLAGFSLAQGFASQPYNAGTAPQGASAVAPHPPMSFTSGTVIRAELEKTIDAKKAKVGDPVLAKTTDDLKSNPPGLTNKGCKIVGHVAEVTPHEGDSASTLGIAFDKVILKDGYEMALPAAIQAIGFADSFVPVNDDQTITKMGGNVGVQPGAGTGPIGAGSGQPSGYGGQRMPSRMPTNSDAKLPFNAQGAVGMPGVSLSPGPAQDTVLSSKKRNVKVESGMQMILRVY